MTRFRLLLRVVVSLVAAALVLGSCSFDPYKLPHDHHELIAMIAPRATIILGNDDYDWLGDESGYKSTIAAMEVFKALGVADHGIAADSGRAGRWRSPRPAASVAPWAGARRRWSGTRACRRIWASG